MCNFSYNEDMKKIGILTFHRAINYGAVLQAYALQTFIKNNCKDREVEFIDYYESDIYASTKFRNIVASSFVKRLVLFFLSKVRRVDSRMNKFKFFVNKYLNVSRKSWNSAANFLLNPPEYDYYITGSDQVFNPYCQSWQVNFLGFFEGSKSKKISYAASFGVTVIPDEKKDCIREYLRDFDAISVRERQGVDIVSQMGLKAIQVVDPVFLLTSNEWQNIMSPKVSFLRKQQNYIFVFDLNGGDSLLKKAYELSKKTGLPIYCLSFNIKQRYNVSKVVYDLSPNEFLTSLMNATYVITDSFHGTAFSLNFRKNFFTYIALKGTSSRIYSMLELFNLKDRIIYSEDDFPEQLHINYDNKRLETLSTMLSESKKFLLHSLDCNI